MPPEKINLLKIRICNIFSTCIFCHLGQLVGLFQGYFYHSDMIVLLWLGVFKYLSKMLRQRVRIYRVRLFTRDLVSRESLGKAPPPFYPRLAVVIRTAARSRKSFCRKMIYARKSSNFPCSFPCLFKVEKMSPPLTLRRYVNYCICSQLIGIPKLLARKLAGWLWWDVLYISTVRKKMNNFQNIRS